LNTATAEPKPPSLVSNATVSGRICSKNIPPKGCHSRC
jgi:hypothetical protein